jgi:hypothetical protein
MEQEELQQAYGEDDETLDNGGCEETADQQVEPYQTYRTYA